MANLKIQTGGKENVKRQVKYSGRGISEQVYDYQYGGIRWQITMGNCFDFEERRNFVYVSDL